MSLRSVFLRTIICKNKPPRLSATVVTSTNYHRRNDSYEKFRKHSKGAVGIGLSSVLIGSAIVDQLKNESPSNGLYIETIHYEKNNDKPTKPFEAGDKIPNLPTYRAEEVSKHNTKESFWVTYRHGVYDMTSFLPSHPGGDQIMNAGGLSIEPFWNVYGMHKVEQVFKLLEEHRIGNLHDDDIVDHSDEELWVREPVRDHRLTVRTPKPFNAEIPPKYQIDYFDTPNELFYVRQHMPVPELDARSHSLTVTIVSGDSDSCRKVSKFTLEELVQKFPRVTVRAALMCAGNRRSEMDKATKPVKGIGWQMGAVSNAVWSGVSLREVLLACGVDETNMAGKHAVFTGADIDATGTNFSTSIPLEMAMNPNLRAVLATHMNGEPLPPDHGRPLRVVIPGAPAVRSVKWLESITVSTSESSSHWHKKDYRGFNPSRTWEDADFETAPPVYSLPVTSAICDPVDGQEVNVVDGKVTVRGYAYSGGGAKILRVDVTSNGGQYWHEATLVRADDAPAQQHYAWTLWEVQIPAEGKEMELWAKATDSNFNTQPESFNDIWNIRGILSNAYHRIQVKIQY